jgi:hypothetical protein
MVADPTTYGLPEGQVYPTTLLDSLYPYYALQGNTALQLALAQYGSRDTQAQLNAQLQGDAMRANATTAAAGIGAGASAYGAQVGALAQLAATNADAATRVLIAAGGDKNAANRLAAELMMQAGLANQATTMELGRRGGSGDLRENFGRMLALAGQGSMPGTFSAMNGLPSPYITAPGVQYSEYGSAPQASMNLPSYNAASVPSFSAPNVTVPNMDLGALYGSLYSGLGGLAGTGLGTAPTAPTGLNGNGVINPTVAPVPGQPVPGGTAITGGGFVSDQRADQVALDQGLGYLNNLIYGAGNGPTPMAGGGTLRPGETALVGERGPEIAENIGGRVQVKPIKYQLAEGGSFDYGGGDLPTGIGGDVPRNAAGYSLESPLAKLQRQRKEAAAAKAEADAVLTAPDPTPTPTDIAASTTQSYDAGLPGQSAPLTPGQLTPGGPLLTDLPFYKALMSGQSGPAWNANIQRPTAPEVGITEGVPLPFERSNVYQRSDPIQQQAMSQLWAFMGVPEAMQNFWLTRSTPGYRANPVQALGF